MNKIISFGLCPFVQRSIITMNYKNVPYDVEYIDLANKPDWFLKLSPTGKVPVLKVKDTVLFESAVINEYVDETNGPSLHSKDPLIKAQERGIIELAGVAIMNYFNGVSATNEQAYLPYKDAFQKNLSYILEQFQGPYFRGNDFSLVDTSVIPIFNRLLLSPSFIEDLELSDENEIKLKIWQESTLSLESVKNSVPPNFELDFKDYLKSKESYIFLKS